MGNWGCVVHVRWVISGEPHYSILKVRLEPGEGICARPGAVIYASGDVRAKLDKGLALGEALVYGLVGEIPFTVDIFKTERGGELWLAPPLPGDIRYLELRGRALLVRGPSYLAHHGQVHIAVDLQPIHAIDVSEDLSELVWLEVTGLGGAWVFGYGGIEQVDLRPGERVIVDSSHLVAMDGDIKWDLEETWSLSSTIHAPTKVVVRAEGPGRLMIQARSPLALAGLLSSYRGEKQF